MSDMVKHILIIAGENSSDNHGAKLIKHLKTKGNVKVTAVGGNKMGSVADKLEMNIVDKAAVGFAEVIKLIPDFIKLKNQLVDKYFRIDAIEKIDGLVLIDFPGFNVRLAKIAKKYGIPVFYYITPQVWAWGSSRIKLLSNLCRKLYCLFEFEKELFEKEGANIEFVGHPILEDIPESVMNNINTQLGITEADFLIALLPGSRVSEVKRHLPVMIKAVEDLKCSIILGKAPGIDAAMIKSIDPEIKLTENVHGLIRRADMCVLSSGTTTLEAAIAGTPFITVYKISWLSYIIARLLVKIKRISMVNILAGKDIVPELIQKQFNPVNLRSNICEMMNNSEKLSRMKQEFKSVVESLGTAGASARTAESILKEIC